MILLKIYTVSCNANALHDFKQKHLLLANILGILANKSHQ
jgi:hypothetical protein